MKFSVLAASLVLLSTAYAHSADGASADDTARFLAGLHPSSDSPLAALARDGSWQQHARHFNAAFGNVEERRLSKIRSWSAANLKSQRPVLFYMFGGPDFLYANAFFPNASTYVLSGLEPVGQIPEPTKLPRGSLWQGLGNIQHSLRSSLTVSFFITSEMGSDLHRSALNGTLPILYVFLARAKKEIREVTLVHLNDQGEVQDGDGAAKRSQARGVKIVFAAADGRVQTLYYFSTNLANDGFNRSGFAKFCEKLGDGDGFVKSASYLMHGSEFSQVRNFLLDRSATLLQDDTGVPVHYFDNKKWQLMPYGHYLGPIPIFRGNYQQGLAQLYQKQRPGPIDFGVGYRWNPQESNLLLATKAISSTSQ